jgi:hypothetical protein
VVYAVWQISHGGLSAGDTAGVLGLPLGVAGLVVTVVALRRLQEGTEADLALAQAKTLARLVETSEGRVLVQLLGADTERINLRYDLLPATERTALAPPAGLAVADASVPLPDIAAYYRDTRPARLVVTGAPGAGKTVLVLELILALIETRADGEPVPVRVPLAQWDTNLPLREMLVQRLADAYNLPSAVAVNVVRHNLVLPVLDGLDEMDPVRPDGTPDPAAPRARAALEQLSVYQDAGSPAPLVLACRTAHYNALAATGTLLDAARIAVAPVRSNRAVAYLTARARDLPRWQLLLDHLTAHPASAHARLLSTPWRLCLTATVYTRTGDPAELLAHPTAEDLDEHLLARYISAATTAAADANPHNYTPQQIHHWLHHLASHLAPTPGTPTRTDIALDRLWLMAGRARVRTADALLATLACLLPLPLAWTFSQPAATARVWLALAVVMGAGHGLLDRSRAARLDLRRLASRYGRAGPSDVPLVLMGGPVLFGLVGRLLFGSLGTPIGLLFGLVFGLMAGLMIALQADQSSAATPGAIISEDMQFALVVALVPGLLFGLVPGLAAGVAAGVAAGLLHGLLGLVVGLVFGLVVGPILGLVVGPTQGASGASWRYLVFLLCARGRVPFRLARFLDWGCVAGLMRYSGSAYQFRHREFQMWLAVHPDPIS